MNCSQTQLYKAVCASLPKRHSLTASSGVCRLDIKRQRHGPQQSRNPAACVPLRLFSKPLPADAVAAAHAGGAVALGPLLPIYLAS